MKQPARIKKRRDFLRVQKSGFRFQGQFLVITSRRKWNSEAPGHFGIVAPKTIGKANVRNLVKRRLRHIVSMMPELLLSHDVVLLASSRSPNASFADLQNDIANASANMRTPPPRQTQRNDKRKIQTSTR